MTTNHIDQLAQWYADAEQVTKDNLPNKGDVIIFPAPSFPGYITETIPVAWPSHLVSPREHVRILARAPKPKPAWHDAVAVMARCSNAPEGHREPFIRSEATPDVWIGEGGYGHTGDLRDVTPLIEAKVTDEMLLRALNAAHGSSARSLDWYSDSEAGDMRDALTAALGLETA